MDETWKEHIIVAGIDFGTTYSGFVISILHDYRKDKTAVLTHEWKPEEGQYTVKTPTCLLLTEDGSFHSFGYEAEEKYAHLAEKDQHKPWRYFRRFKMKLFSQDKKVITENDDVYDAEQRPFKALYVFEHSIRFLKGKIEQMLKEKLKGQEDLVHYVITTPAIWSEASKQFMRSAAVKAGIPEHRLRIALEPECAALYVKERWFQAIDDMSQGKVFTKGSRHMIVDMGGGTIDIAGHQVNDEGKLVEIAAPDGGPWGGDTVNERFDMFLQSLIGAEAFRTFQTEYREDYLELTRQFEARKKSTRSEQATVRLSESFRTLHKERNQEDLSATLKHVPHSESLELIKEKLRIDEDLFRSFFKEAADNIVAKIKEVLDKLTRPVDTIICVGGFSECAMVRERINCEFSMYSPFFPPDPVASIMKGAVIYGRDEREIVNRVSRYTYGLDWNEDFDDKVHHVSKKEKADDGFVCKDIFFRLTKKGEVFPPNGKEMEIEAYVKTIHQRSIEFPFYRSEVSEAPKYIDDVGCVHVGTLVVDLGQGMSIDDPVRLKVIFGATELKAEAVNTHGKRFEVNFSIREGVQTVVSKG